MVDLIARIVAFARSPMVTVVALIVVNLIPLIGVLSLGWDAYTLLILYWIESGVVGIINVFKILRAEGPTTIAGTTIRITGWRGASWTQSAMHPGPAASTAQGAVKGVLVFFFLLHYGIFWIVHGVFVFVLPLIFNITNLFMGQRSLFPSLDVPWLVFAAIALFVSHLFSYWVNFIGRGEYRNISPAAQMMQPYGRVFVLHLVIVLGGTLIFTLGQPVALLVLLVIGKTVLDIALHLRAHARAQTPPTVIA